MSGREEAWIECDGEDCANDIGMGVGCVSIPEARDYAKERGWKVARRGDSDYCPECRESS